MIFRKGYRFRLRPNVAQRMLCAQFAGGARWVFNRGLALRDKSWKEENKSTFLYQQNKELTVLKYQEETLWLQDIHSQVLQQSLHDLDNAFKQFFQRIQKKESAGYPKFKCKGEQDSFRYPQGAKVKNSHVWLPKIGWVRFRKSREIEGKIKQTTVIKEGHHWYVAFSCELDKEVIPTKGKDIIGIDVGLEHFATVASDQGMEEIESSCFLKKSLSKIRYLSRKVSRKKKGSNQRLQAKLTLATIHAKIRNQRQDVLHKLSTRLVKSHDVIVIESLKVQKLLKEAPKQLARAISDAGWRTFLQMLKYKCEETGKVLLEVGQYFPSTKQCYHCKKKNEIALSTRIYRCDCGYENHRDHNAALNLKAAGMSV